MMPILSSFNIPSVYSASVDQHGEATGSSASPFGSVSFSETGPRRYHALKDIPGGLRSFQLQAELVPKDTYLSRKVFKLPPQGRFSVQLLFVQRKKV